MISHNNRTKPLPTVNFIHEAKPQNLCWLKVDAQYAYVVCLSWIYKLALTHPEKVSCKPSSSLGLC